MRRCGIRLFFAGWRWHLDNFSLLYHRLSAYNDTQEDLAFLPRVIPTVAATTHPGNVCRRICRRGATAHLAGLAALSFCRLGSKQRAGVRVRACLFVTTPLSDSAALRREDDILPLLPDRGTLCT